MAVAEGSFEPAAWLYNGTGRVAHGQPPGTWDVRWHVDDVTSRLTMMAADGTDVYALETYPVDNAYVTPQDPPCQTLCARRENDAPFLAVWDAWRESPNLRTVAAGDAGRSLALTTQSNAYHLLFGPGATRFDDEVFFESDAALAVMRNHDGLLFVGGTYLATKTPDGSLRITSDCPGTVSAEWEKGVVTLETAGNIHYDTYAGRDHYRDAPDMTVDIDGDLWRVRGTRLRFAGYLN
jgi:hypothetical protein